MAENQAEKRFSERTKIVCTLPPPPPISDELKQAIIGQYETMMPSVPLPLKSLNGADNGGHLQSRSMKRDYMDMDKLSKDENVEIQKALSTFSSPSTPLHEERIALSDKYKRLRRKVQIKPVRDPRLQSDQKLVQKRNVCTFKVPRIDHPLRQHNLNPHPNANKHVGQPLQQHQSPSPQRETYRDHKHRKEMEAMEARRAAQEAAASTAALGAGIEDDEEW